MEVEKKNRRIAYDIVYETGNHKYSGTIMCKDSNNYDSYEISCQVIDSSLGTNIGNVNGSFNMSQDNASLLNCNVTGIDLRTFISEINDIISYITSEEDTPAE
jgi:hypothetical protein